MATKKDLQLEILNELKDYSDNIIEAVNQIIEELRNGRKEDTDELFNMMIQGINWVIEVFNNCEDLINNGEERVDKNKMAQAVSRLGSVLRDKDDIKIAACLEVDFLPFLTNMGEISKNIEGICMQNE